LVAVADVPVAAGDPFVDEPELAIAVVAFVWNIAATSLRARDE
jgi:hypothetical protein